MNIFEKIKFILKKPKAIIITGNGRQRAKEAIFQILKPRLRIGEDVLIFETDLTNYSDREKAKFLIRHSSLPVLAVIHFDKDFSAGEKKDIVRSKKLAKNLPPYGHLILNFDDETAKRIKEEDNLKETTFGFQEGADFQVTDVKLNTQAQPSDKAGRRVEMNECSSTNGINFKINYKGSIVPVWLTSEPDSDERARKEQIYSVMGAVVAGTVLGLNLVEISNVLKSYPH